MQRIRLVFALVLVVLIAAGPVMPNAAASPAIAPYRDPSGLTTRLSDQVRGTSVTSTQARQSAAAWTVMVYVAGDNNLETFALADLNEMEFVGSTDEVNVVVQIDRAEQYDRTGGDWTGARRLFVTRDTRLTTLGSEVVGDLGETNTGDPATLVDFATWAITTYPAERYALILWDHGGAWLGIAADESAQQDEIRLPELDTALQQIITSTGVPQLDLIGFDACLMGTLEVYHTIAPYGRYAVGSPELIPGSGWDYLGLLDALNADPAMDGAALGRAIVDSFITFYTEVVTTYPIFNLALVDLAQTKSVVERLDALSRLVQNDPLPSLDAISHARFHTPLFGAFNDPQYVDFWSAADLFQFMRLLGNSVSETPLAGAAEEVVTAGDHMILYFRGSDPAPAQSGVSIFFPRNPRLYQQQSRDTRYAVEAPETLSPWLTFLQTFYDTAQQAADPSRLGLAFTGIQPSGKGLNLWIDPAGTSWLELVILLDMGQGRQVVVDRQQITPESLLAAAPSRGHLARLVAGGLPYTWPGLVYQANLGSVSLPVLIYRHPAYPGLGVLNGIVYQPDGAPAVDAQMTFDLVTGESTGLWALISTAGALMPSQMSIQPGSIFEPYWWSLTPDGNLVPLPAPGQFSLDNWPLTVAAQPAPPGVYTAQVTGEDAAGNTAQITTRFTSDGEGGIKPVDPNVSWGDQDLDGDGIRNLSDNCMSVFNPDQANGDGDLLGDVCDSFDDNIDTDGDGVLDLDDNCPVLPNPDQGDIDLDGVGDACAMAGYTDPAQRDHDEDGIPDIDDNCILNPNPDQEDRDEDDTGDACDSVSGSTGNDPVGDLYTYALDAPSTDPNAAAIDLRNLKGGFTGFDLPPAGVGSFESPWIGSGTGVSSSAGAVEFDWGATFKSDGGQVSFYMPGGAGAWIDGGPWASEFMGPDSDLAITPFGSTSVFFWDTSSQRLPHVYITPPGQGFSFGGARGAYHFDEASGTSDAYLIEGSLDVLPDGQRFEHALGTTAVHVRMTADNTVTSEEVSLNQALQQVPPEAYSLVFQITMVNPVVPGTEEMTPVWHIMFDLDGDPTTGLPPDIHPTYAGLGVEFEFSVTSIGDQLVAGGLFNMSAGTELAGQASLSEDGRTLTVLIPLPDLIEQSAALGYTVSPAMRWRASAVLYGGENDPKDVYPEPDFDFAASVGGDFAPGETNWVDADVSVSSSVANGGPVAEFQDRTVSPADNPITNWLWNFGDGTTSTEQHPAHTYAEPGEYTVTLDLTFANGGQRNISQRVTITVGSGVPPTESSSSGEDSAATPAGQLCTASTTGGANLRGGPGTGYEVVGSTAAGESLNISGINAAGDWYQIEREDIDAAWIAGFLITVPECPAGVALPVTG